MLAKNFQVDLRIQVVAQTNIEIGADDKRKIRFDRTADQNRLRPYVREVRRFCLN
jgi:hypothetical protein